MPWSLPYLCLLMNGVVLRCLLASLLSACSPSQPLNPGGISEQNGEPALHAVRDKELRLLMDQMNGLMLERFMNEQEIDVERRRYNRQIAQAAADLKNTARNLVSKAPGLGLTDEQQKAYTTLAGKLSDYAQHLQKQAELQSFNAMSNTLRDMKSTCIACHTLFRKP